MDMKLLQCILSTSIILTLSLLVSCGGDQKKKETKNHGDLLHNSTNKTSTHFITGDPLNLIKGTTKNPQSFLNLDNLKSFNNFRLIRVMYFVSKKKINPEQSKDIEKGNEAPTEERKSNYPFFQFKEFQDGYLFSSKETKELKFYFEKEANSSLIGLKYVLNQKNEKVSVNVHHYSLKADGKAFSILVDAPYDQDSTEIVAFTFSSPTNPIRSQPGNSKYFYLNGAGVKHKWSQNQSLKISLCSADYESALTDLFKESVHKWSKALKGRLDVIAEISQEPAPFSDLNQNCIFTPDNFYQTNPRDPRIMSGGAAIPLIDVDQAEILQSDIFLWPKEFQKFNLSLADVKEQQKIYKSVSRTMTHEIGHLLGLHHQFTKGVKSIMSYSRERFTELQSYDIKAIQHLYPKTSEL